ncbi:MAG: M48 family metalloprotease [Acidobacteria bacterium]|nr:M48 family metalloprotease [Acidobacteriota bacterium]
MIQKAFRFVGALMLSLSLTVMPVAAQSKDLKPLDEKNNPLLIGKRDINKGQLAFYSIDKEIALGRQMAMEIDRSSQLVTDPIVNEFINRVSQNIVLHSDAKIPFTIKVIDSNEINAFALPGGFLYVNRGLLEAADNEAEVAGVLAHEIAHVTARHGIEQASKGQLLNIASIPLIFFGGLGGFIVQQVAGIAVPLTFLKFSRGAEKEADRLGAQYMWAAGYDPNALISFFEKLQAKNKKEPGTLAKVFSSHPMTGDRIKETQKLIVRFPEKSEYQLSSSDFNQIKSRLYAVSAASRSMGGEDMNRPTLKRRPQRTDNDTTGEPVDNDRPTLKRRDSSSDEAERTGDSSDVSDRPVLKRREGSSAEPEPAPEKPAEKPAEKSPDAPADQSKSAPEKPVLKRKPDSGN